MNGFNGPPNAPTSSLKPFARSLSHELRTPMTGVIGMLDVMHATVNEAMELQPNTKTRNIFQTLKESIEVVQDSSRRAVEAADNIVFAYELNMQVPETPLKDGDSPVVATSSSTLNDSRSHIALGGGKIVMNTHKRQKTSPTSWSFGNTTKPRVVREAGSRSVSPMSEKQGLKASPKRKRLDSAGFEFGPATSGLEGPQQTPTSQPTTSHSNLEVDPGTPSVLRRSRIRDLVPVIIQESLRVGGRPDSSIAEPTPLGERIEVRVRSSSGHASHQIIEWSVQPEVPEIFPLDERDLTKLISCVFLNAIKFTENGQITVRVSMSESMRSARINIKDTGPGIPKDFLPALFKPFSREDDSLTRNREGLGLGLMVGKGLARRLGGDLTVVSTETSGANTGSEFEIRIPVAGNDRTSEPGTPYNRTPSPCSTAASSANQRPRASQSLSATSFPQRMDLSGSTPSQRATPRVPNDSYFPPNAHEAHSSARSTSPRRLSLSTRTPTLHRAPASQNFKLALDHPLTFLVAEDNRINRKLLVQMLNKFGYHDVHEAYDGREAVRVMQDLTSTPTKKAVDVVLMDLWMPEMDGYEATERILDLFKPATTSCEGSSGGDSGGSGGGSAASSLVTTPTATPPIVVAVSADVTEKAINRATSVGMEGFMTKPYKLMDLQRLIEAIVARIEA